MTIGQLKQMIKEYQEQLSLTDDSKVIMSGDAEGNDFHDVANTCGLENKMLIIYPEHSELEL